MENQELIQQMKLGVLKDTFTQHPETSVKQYKVDSRWCRFIHGVESEEELWEREYTNGDLVMRTREAVGEMVATILDLKIIDTKASKLLSLGFSFSRNIDDPQDLRYALFVMDEQRKIESERKQAA